MIDQVRMPNKADGKPPGHRQRLVDKIMTAFHQARDQHDFHVAAQALSR
jgi:hypothetical protein